MRDYIYLWRDTSANRLVASGIEFQDIAAELAASTAGVFLLSHGHEDVVTGPGGLDFVYAHEISALASDAIESFGDFSWADCRCGSHVNDLPSISAPDVAALLYFKHEGKPLDGARLESIDNRFLVNAHDDGWRWFVYAADWSHVEALIRPLIAEFLRLGEIGAVLSSLREGQTAWLLDARGGIEVEGTSDIDRLMNEGLIG